MIFKQSNEGIQENIDAVINETLFDPSRLLDNLLVVEGKDDITVFSNYFSNNDNDLSIRVISANSESETQGVDGKYNAITKYKELKSQKRKVVCVLDRDWDLFINNSERDKYIHYYDFYEIENYLFEDVVFSKYLLHVLDYDDQITLDDIMQSIHDYEKAALPLFKLRILKEYHTKNNIFNESEWHSIKNITDYSQESIMNRKDDYLKSYSKFDKIQIFLENQLGEMGWNFKLVDQELKKHNLFLDYFNKSEPLYAFKYFVKGKEGPNNMKFILANLVKSLHNCKFFLHSNQAALRTLFLEWLPHHSEKFKLLVTNITNDFKCMQVAG
ncbi:hypothetical protein [Exiguobacterium artemiae]|uniref:hypothetical protein n=1 Tax=Exiguobacterium artemiae TaxID=340145 RepID=UPI003CFC7A98